MTSGNVHTGTGTPAAARWQFRGLSVSEGIARGRARVVRTPAESHAVRPGEILVVPTLFASHLVAALEIAGGFVAERGGTSADAWAFARRLRVPAVILASATSVLRSGDLLYIDGATGRGEVEFPLEESPPQGIRAAS
jgi:pyruvate,water dikinase